MRRILLLALLLLTAAHARAVIVRGHVTSSLGAPLPATRVQLIELYPTARSVADTISGVDGAYEIRTTFSGRFLLLTAPSLFATNFAPQVGTPFYASTTDLVTLDIVLNHAGITPQLSSQQTLVPTPLPQLATHITQLRADQFLTRLTPIEELRDTPGALVLQQGQLGSPASLYLRGAPPATVLVEVDHVTANPLGSSFDLSTLAASALAALSPVPAVELAPTPNPLYLTGASGGILALDSPRSDDAHRTLTYTGDAGNLTTYQNEAVASYAHNRYDLLGAFSRFDTANDLPLSPYHLVTWSANAGYHISANTSLRAEGRYDLSASGLTSPFQFFLLQPLGREAHQNLFASATFDTRNAAGWHNLVRYGLARTRAETFDYSTPAIGLPVALTAANGFTASGIAAFNPLPPREDTPTLRDEATWQSDYKFKPWLGLVGEFRFQNERSADILPSARIALDRTHISGALGLSGSIKQRFFYESSGFLDHTQQLGFTGSPRVGVTYAPVRPGLRRFRGTWLHLSAATGTREPSVLEETANPRALQTPRSRTLEASVDQNILAQKLTLRSTYVHNQFSHEFEPIGLSAIASQPILSQSLALHTQGLESVLRYLPFRRLELQGGYSYLAALTEQSAASPVFNPSLPTTRIGGFTAFVGQRPFQRPPHTGFFLAEYSGSRLNASIRGSFASRSDDSTRLLQTPTLLLPNHDLSPGYFSLDTSLSAVVTRRVTLFTQLTNLTDNRHIAAFGFLSTPFLIRTGLRIRLGSE